MIFKCLISAYASVPYFSYIQVIIISDSPSSQYRNRSMVHLMAKICGTHGISAFEWIYSEAGHGKGAPDGVGASVKRLADSYVTHQRQNILSAKDIIPLLTDTKILPMLVRKI